MKIRTKTKKKHTLKLADAELGILVKMLGEWKKQYADQLPAGAIHATEIELYKDLYYAMHNRFPNEPFGSSGGY